MGAQVANEADLTWPIVRRKSVAARNDRTMTALVDCADTYVNAGMVGGRRGGVRT